MDRLAPKINYDSLFHLKRLCAHLCRIYKTYEHLKEFLSVPVSSAEAHTWVACVLMHLDIRPVVFEVAVVELAVQYPCTLLCRLKMLLAVARVKAKIYGVHYSPHGGGCAAVIS